MVPTVCDGGDGGVRSGAGGGDDDVGDINRGGSGGDCGLDGGSGDCGLDGDNSGGAGIVGAEVPVGQEHIP